MEKKRQGVIEGMSRIVSDPYYFLHFMAFFSYLPIRNSAAQYTSQRLFDREVQAFLAFLMFSAIKVCVFFEFTKSLYFFAFCFMDYPKSFVDGEGGNMGGLRCR